MGSDRPILESIDYAVEREGHEIKLKVEAVYVTFVEEIIPDGQLAGMIGHRPVRNHSEITYDLHPGHARMLRDQLDAALFGLDET